MARLSSDNTSENARTEANNTFGSPDFRRSSLLAIDSARVRISACEASPIVSFFITHTFVWEKRRSASRIGFPST